MAEYTLTIKDEDGSVAVLMEGPAATDSPATTLAHVLFGLAPKILTKAAHQSADGCDCEACKRRRNQAAARASTTIH